MTESILLERLIVEAARRGRLEHQIDDLIAALDAANKGIKALTAERTDLLVKIENYKERIVGFQGDARLIVALEQESFNVLRNLTDRAKSLPIKKGREETPRVRDFREAVVEAIKIVNDRVPF
jgi:hypothetical protein